MNTKIRRGVTLVEVLVVAAILATLVGLMLPVLIEVRGGQRDSEDAPPVSRSLYTAQHDGHWWIMHPQYFAHHPDCPCRSRRVEREPQQ